MACQQLEEKQADHGKEEPDFQQAQRQDHTLSKAWSKGEGPDDSEYIVEDGLLFHKSLDSTGADILQLVLPVSEREKAIRVAHSKPIAGHTGMRKTAQKLLECFFWPGLNKDVRRSCGQCQKAARVDRQKAPLMPLPVVDQPFDRIAMDIVGPLQRSRRGNRYVLTIMDYATKYPEAIPLKRIDTKTVADALVQVFARLGIPRELLTDQGSNFTSGLMHERATEDAGHQTLEDLTLPPPNRRYGRTFQWDTKNPVEKELQ